MKKMIWLFVVLFALTRLPRLTLLPIFNDEASYLDWGWRAIHLGAPWHSLYDAKQPLYIWLYGISETVISDPLLAGRLISVITGFFTLLGIYRLTLYLFGRRPALFSVLCFLFTPLLVFYDRQALFETAIAAMGIWSAYFLIRLCQLPRLKYALALGGIFAFGFWVKSSALLFILPFFFGYLILAVRRPPRAWRLSLAIYLGLTCLFLLSPLLFQSQFWATFFPTTREFALPANQILRFPLFTWLKNTAAHLDIMFWQLSPPIFLLALVGIYLSLKSGFHRHLLLVLLFFAPWTLETLLVRGITPRYLTPFLVFIPVYAGLALARFPKLAVFLIIPAGMVFIQLFHPITYFQTLARITRYSFIETYICCAFTGYPTMDAIRYIRTLPSSNQPIFVGSFLNPGNPPSALFAYFRRHPLITTGYLDTKILTFSLDKIDCLTSDIPVYYLGENHYQAGFDRFLQPVREFPNPHGSDETVTLYTFKKDCTGTTIKLNPTR
jgi:4-amino-4-deoxy-L-arabinose transferase-like glycosyltransferase